MPKTLILLFHPNLAKSSANSALAAAASKVDGVQIADLHAIYPDGGIDIDAEIERMTDCDRVIFQFPVQWYSTPALLKQWQDVVLTRMFYINPELGAAIRGKPVLVAATAGNRESAYRTDGANLFPLEQLLKPLHSTAHRCGLKWSNPFLVYESNKLPTDALEAEAARYAARITEWIAEGHQHHG